MKTTISTYQNDWENQSLPAIDALMAQMPISGAIDILNWPEQYPNAPATIFTLAHTNDMLFVRFEVKDELPLATHIQDLEHVNEDACVEIFIANAANTRYWNFEFNAAGVCNASCRKSRKEDVVRLNAEQLQSIIRFPVQLCTASWSLLIAIPMKLIEFNLENEQSRRVNLYKCGDLTPNKHYASWNPIEAPVPAFHLPEFFGEIQFKNHKA